MDRGGELEKRIEGRIEKLRRTMAEEGIDTMMVQVPENRRYLSGYTGEDTQCDESAGVLFITDGKLLLATDSRYDLQAENEADGYEVFRYSKGLSKEISAILDRLGTERLGYESIRLSCMEHRKIEDQLASERPGISLVPTEDMVERIRIIKEEAEIDAIRAALSLAESAFISVLGSLAPGQTEAEVAWSLEKRMREAGAEAVSFSTIVACGPNSALPHAVPGKRKIEAGAPILFDWGAKLGGYCSDISRTFVIGQPDDTFRSIHRTVLEAQRLAIEAVRPGVSSREIDRIARDHIERAGFKGKFGHGLGHGVGLAIHEQPRLSPLKETILDTGMVFTVEPGIYLAGWGGVRLENMAVVRENGGEVLNVLDYGDTLDYYLSL
jgi:Xaa-Pro aminopeptidase